jgi:hypothetical protein
MKKIIIWIFFLIKIKGSSVEDQQREVVLRERGVQDDEVPVRSDQEVHQPRALERLNKSVR